MAMPRDYMARCAQYGPRVIFEYRDDKLTPELDYLRFIGYVLASAEAARRWDDRPQNLVAWYALPSWAAAETWLYDPDGYLHANAPAPGWTAPTVAHE